MKPRYTIGIATRNRPVYLAEAIESALKQKVSEPFEVLVVDDASDLASARALLDQLGAPNLRVVRRLEHGGEAACRNTIIENMEGEFVLWLDDDDVLLPEALSSHVRCLQANPTADVIYANLIRTNEVLEPEREYRYRAVQPEHLLCTLFFYSPFPNGSSFIRKSLFERVGGYDTSHAVGTDYDFWVRAALGGAKFVHHDDFIYLYRGHDGNAALGDEGEEFCKSNARVISKLLQAVSLEGIFTIFNWNHQPARARALAQTAAGLMFYRYRCYEDASRLVGQAENDAPLEAAFARSLLLGQQGKVVDGYHLLQQALFRSHQTVRELVTMCGLRDLQHHFSAAVPSYLSRDPQSES